jgi:outer membrane protein OmpA-like peptidoglycan-associated protein
MKWQRSLKFLDQNHHDSLPGQRGLERFALKRAERPQTLGKIRDSAVLAQIPTRVFTPLNRCKADPSRRNPMSIVRTALPLVLLTSVLTGCAGLQKTDWPTCAAVGGVVGAGLGATESTSWAGGGALFLGTMAAAYCWVHGDGDEDGDGVPDSRDKCPGTPKGVQVDADGCPPPAPAPVVEEPVVVKEETIVVRDVHFEFNKSTLTAADKQVLSGVATRLKQESSTAQLRVTGHTDSVGSNAYNQRLSEKRANSVVQYLVESGVPRASFVSVAGAGESQPVADNKTADGRAMNRRTEIKINR